MGVQLVYTPVMINLLGQSEYGLYTLVASVVSYLSLLTLGFGASYIRFYSRYKSNKTFFSDDGKSYILKNFSLSFYEAKQ